MKKKKTVTKKTKSSCNSGLFVPAGTFIGMGIGFLTGQLVAFMFIGMGIGFLLKAFIKN